MNQYPLTAAAAQVENFETLNEGMWVTPQAIQNIEATLESNAALIATTNETAQALSDLAGTNNANVIALDAANSTIAERDETITALEARIAELEADGTGFQSTSREADSTGGQEKVPFHLSNENPFNALADSLTGGAKKK